MFKSRIFSLALFYFIAFVTGVAWNFVPAASEILTTTYQITSLEYGSLYSIFVLGAILYSLICSIFGDRIGFYRVILIALLFNLISALCFSFLEFIPGPNYLYLALGMLFLGAGVGGVIVGLGVGSIHVAKKYKTTALILNFAFLGIGSAITPFYVNAASAGGWLGMGCLIWGGCFALQFIFALMNRTIKRLVVSLKRYETFSHMVTFWKDIPKAFWLIALAVFFYSISEVTFWDWGVIYLKEAKALTAAQAGDASAFYWVAATIADVFFALIFLKYNYKLYHRLIPILILVSYLFLITSTGLSALLLSLALAGFSCTLFFPLSVRLASETYPKIETRVFGFLLSIYFLGSGLSTYLIGLFRGSLSISISKGFFIIPLAALLTLLLLNLFYIRRSKPAA